ncbi:MAG: DUF4912 domain-containing protein [Spirochaetaceae bacterium]|jgi:hypothetical protein|nr:DUF4912 domain-containing protein [Spirochaetaceae bacterium]
MEFSKLYLEKLSTSELAALAHAHGIEIPPALDRIFIIEELLELSNDYNEVKNASDAALSRHKNFNTQNYTNERDVSFGKENPRIEGSSEPAKLPSNYNVSVIYAIVRDPLWVFISWELLQSEKKALEAQPNFNGYCLKITKRRDKADKNADCYVVPVGNDDTTRYLHFTPSCGMFKVELCALANNREIILAKTANFNIPKTLNTEDENIQKNKIWLLSGINDFDILKNVEIHRKKPVFRAD